MKEDQNSIPNQGLLPENNIDDMNASQSPIKNGIVEKIETKLSEELQSAAAAMDQYNMSGLAEEFRSLMGPFDNRNIINERSYRKTN